MRRLFAAIVSIACFSGACAQEPGPLSKPLSGRYFYRGDSNVWSLTPEKVTAEGVVEGKVTYYGKLCTAKETPLKNGTFHNGELIFTVDMESCPGMLFTLKQTKDHRFEGVLINTNYRDRGEVKVYLD